MKIGVLTSSRADYGIYQPLLEAIKKDDFFEIEIIAFGTHLAKSHGFTVSNIQNEGYNRIHKISSLISNDEVGAISSSYGLTCLKFAEFWEHNIFDLVFCLGDRFEMSAAVQASIPFGVKLAHIHGGETTLGAIDNIYRHQISLASSIHFTAADMFTDKLNTLLGESKNIFTVGSLSLSNIKSFLPIKKKEFYSKYNLPNEEFALVTFHPETVSLDKNEIYANDIKSSLREISKQLFIVITMPNADTLGSIFRKQILDLKTELPNRILLIENFGKTNYFSAMYYAKVLIGNTSSGILEAASFGKYVVNVGDRQKGRLQSDNIENSKFSEIIKSTNKAIGLGRFNGENVYYKTNAVNNIINILKQN